MIKAIQKEPTSVLTYIYPGEVSDTTATVLPIQSIINDFIRVSLAQPLSAGLGRSIDIDLKDTVKTNTNNIQTVSLEPVVDPCTQTPTGSISGNEVNIFPL